ncbi:N-acetyl-gamma-glutamyl-phosphate reductase [Pseudidiomarina planktonica]|uniref:N-acetyl-gamma-glutamyl-phosphate reductase n=1 Tax=Pseudidiomarina planktonica TaxID=1323738 RepID=A0A1Y6G2W5_9GAMM|nr:N-acetyl-gamma-glutamyl-phosphate reductase [Pseudidiomarina planktonica]RUO64001.1 N-acetyl-gamma-glutamyl-phosphate reductase [Pseudidiomarina planktonica]SMQ79907.1 N-acetyl-gamma-glutamyl-phosphate reductase [Pseudidiomarina planktonica]
MVVSNANIACAVFGASGYSGAELVRLLNQHPNFNVSAVFSSSAGSAKPLAELYPQYQFPGHLILQPWHSDLLPQLVQQVRVVFLALPHEASTELVPELLAANSELTIFDLSGAFRLQDETAHAQAYGFDQPKLAQPVPYGLAEWCQLQGNEPVVAVPGCYPTVAALALKPLLPLLSEQSTPIINAVSGVSGAGRKASLTTHFCEVSLQAYGVGTHRHTPEIAQSLQRPVVFTPHLGNFPRGIVATIYAQTNADVSLADINHAYQQAYTDAPLVRLRNQPPAINDVANTPFCDIYAHLSGTQLILCAAIDNLLKGAAAQAVQLANLYFAKPASRGLLPEPAPASGGQHE